MPHVCLLSCLPSFCRTHSLPACVPAWPNCLLVPSPVSQVLPKLLGALLGRIQPSLPVDMQLPWGAKAVLIIYFLLSQLPAVLMLSHFDSYRRWRFWLALANRVYRLVSMSCAVG